MLHQHECVSLSCGDLLLNFAMLCVAEIMKMLEFHFFFFLAFFFLAFREFPTHHNAGRVRGMERENPARNGARHFAEATSKEKLTITCILTFFLLFTSSLNKSRDYKYIPPICF